MAQAALSWAAPEGANAPGARSIIVALVGLAYGGVLALNAATLSTPPRLALVLAAPAAGPASVAWVLPGGTLWERGIRPGAAVLALDGRLPTRQHSGSWQGQRVLARTPSGRVVTVTAADVRSGHDMGPLLWLSLGFLVFGTLIVLRAPTPAAGTAAYLFCLSCALALALAPGADSDEPAATVAEWIAVPCCAALFAHFFLVFPVRRDTPLWRAALLAPPLVASVVALATPAWPALYAGAALLRGLLLLAYLPLGLGLLGTAFPATRDPAARRGLLIISAGTALAILPFVIGYLLPTLLGRPPLLTAEHALLALAILLGSFTYANLRHHVLAVPLLQRWLVYGLLWAALLALYVAAAAVLQALPVPALRAPGPGVARTALLAILVGLSVRRLSDHLKRLLDRLIFKDAYEYRPALQQLSHDLFRMRDLANLGAALPRTLCRLMNLDFALLLVHDSDGSRLHGDAGAYEPAMVRALAESVGAVRDRPRVVTLGHGYLRVLCVPLCTGEALVGHLCLGPKASGEPFRAEDHALLDTLSGHLAACLRTMQLALHNRRLVDDLQAQVRQLEEHKVLLSTLNDRLQHAQEEERRRLAADIHDDVLQTALHLRLRLLADGHHRAATAGHVALADVIIARLRAVCAAVRPAILDELGLTAALEVLVEDLGRHGDVPILLELDPEVEEVRLPGDAELVLYRAVQEALTNGLRHAQPREIRVIVRRAGETVQIRVADDGVGFTVPATLEGLEARGHLGLAGLAHRVRRAGGQVTISSRPGRGTVITVTFSSPSGQRANE